MVAYGTVLVYENGSSTRSNGLKYQNGSLGRTTDGMVALDREQVWLYKYSWPNKTRVGISYFRFARFNIRGFYMKSFKAHIIYDLYGKSISAGSYRPHSTGEEHISPLHQ